MGHTHKKNEDFGKKTAKPRHNPYKRHQFNIDLRIGKNVPQSPSTLEEVLSEITEEDDLLDDDGSYL